MASFVWMLAFLCTASWCLSPGYTISASSFNKARLKVSNRLMATSIIPSKEGRVPVLICDHSIHQIWLPHTNYECEKMCTREPTYTATNVAVSAYTVHINDNDASVCRCQGFYTENTCHESWTGVVSIVERPRYYDVGEKVCQKLCDSEKMWKRSIGDSIIIQENPISECSFFVDLTRQSHRIILSLVRMSIKYDKKGVPFLSLPDTFASCAYQTGWCNPYHGTTLIWRPVNIYECTLQQFFHETCSIRQGQATNKILVSCPNEKSQFVLSHQIDDHCEFKDPPGGNVLVQTESGVILSLPHSYADNLTRSAAALSNQNTPTLAYLLDNLVSQTNAVFDEICYRTCEADIRVQALNKKEGLPTFYHSNNHILKMYPAKSGDCLVACKQISEWNPISSTDNGLLEIRYQESAEITSTKTGILDPKTLEVLPAQPPSCDAELGIVVPGKNPYHHEVWNGSSVHLIPIMEVNYWKLGGIHFAGFIPYIFPEQDARPHVPPTANYTPSGEQIHGDAESKGGSSNSKFLQFLEGFSHFWRSFQWIYIVVITLLLILACGVIYLSFSSTPLRALFGIRKVAVPVAAAEALLQSEVSAPPLREKAHLPDFAKLNKLLAERSAGSS